jgi:hypothetical protein
MVRSPGSVAFLNGVGLCAFGRKRVGLQSEPDVSHPLKPGLRVPLERWHRLR